MYDARVLHGILKHMYRHKSIWIDRLNSKIFQCHELTVYFPFQEKGKYSVFNGIPSFTKYLLPLPLPYLESMHRVFNHHVLRSCASSIFTPFSYFHKI